MQKLAKKQDASYKLQTRYNNQETNKNSNVKFNSVKLKKF
jgi:hypothetical protein